MKRLKRIVVGVLFVTTLFSSFTCFARNSKSETTQYETVYAFNEKDFLRDCKISNQDRLGFIYKPTNITVKNTYYKSFLTKVIELDQKEKIGSTKTIGGKEYTLKKIKENKKTIEEYTDYEKEVSEKDVPKTKIYTDYVGGLKVEYELEFDGITKETPITKTTNATVTYVVYDSDYYEYNGKRIPFNDSYPEIANFQNDVLKATGITNGRVVGATWNGGVYEKDGVKYRNALVTISYPCPIYRANYKKVIEDGTYKATYETPNYNGKRVYEVAYDYEFSHLSNTALVLYSVGGLILIVGIATIIYMFAKKKKKEE